MQIWRYVLAGSVVTALAFVPQDNVTQMATMPHMDANPAFASLKLQKLTPTNVLPARSPVSFFSSRANKPLSGTTICVDPGHGGEGSDPGYTGGTRGCVTGQTEGDVNLRVSLILRQYLQAAGAKVVMTRISDDRCQGGTCKTDELDFRPDTAKRYNADFFISVHHNEASRQSANYTAVFYPRNASKSEPLAENISSAVSRYLGTRNVGSKVGNYRVLNELDGIPGVIVEASFMSNPDEDRRLANLSYNKMEAKAIATGILNYFRTSRGTNVDFQGIFAPIDNQAHTAQAMADASMVGKQLVERKSMFNRSYEEVTVDRSGRQIARRTLGSSSLSAAKKKSSSKSETAKPSPRVEKFVATSQKNAKSLQSTSNSRRVVLTERNKAIGASRPII